VKLEKLSKIAAGRPKISWYQTSAEEFIPDCEFMNACEKHFDALLAVAKAAENIPSLYEIFKDSPEMDYRRFMHNMQNWCDEFGAMKLALSSLEEIP